MALFEDPIAFDCIPSTQDHVKARAQDGAAHGLVVQARVQSGGHGRHGRVWESPPGNLYLSFLLRPNCKALELGQLSLLSGLALYNASQLFISNDCSMMLKWPNDVLIEGKKCAGILLETELGDSGDVKHCVIGVGVNLCAAPKEIGAALNDFSRRAIDADIFRDAFLKCFDTLYCDWLASGFDNIREGWLAAAHKQGSQLSVKISDHLVRGCFHDIDGYGNARILRDDGTIKTIAAGDVYLY